MAISGILFCFYSKHVCRLIALNVQTEITRVKHITEDFKK